jgi:hypothetical protein
VLTGWGERAEFPAVGRIRQRDGVALDPEIVAVLAAYADEAAVGTRLPTRSRVVWSSWRSTATGCGPSCAAGTRMPSR